MKQIHDDLVMELTKQNNPNTIDAIEAAKEAAIERLKAEVVKNSKWTPPDDLKTRINNLLFEVLPGETTIDELEELACEIGFKVCELGSRKARG